MGFVSKQKAEEYLTSGCAHGTFLLRIEEIDFVSCVRPMIMCRCNETDVFGIDCDNKVLLLKTYNFKFHFWT